MEDSIGKELGCRLNRSWHCVRKLRQLPGSLSYLSGGGRCGSWKKEMGADGGDIGPSPDGADGAEGMDVGKGAKVGGTSWTEEERSTICCVMVCTHDCQQLLLLVLQDGALLTLWCECQASCLEETRHRSSPGNVQRHTGWKPSPARSWPQTGATLHLSAGQRP